MPDVDRVNAERVNPDENENQNKSEDSARGQRYWIGVASRDHVLRGVEGGFAQLSHGKRGPLERMAVGDWLIYYSGKLRFGATEPCRRFTAIGQITGPSYAFDMGGGFVPVRRDIHYQRRAREEPVEPLVGKLQFVRDPKRWAAPLRWGHLEISRHDFEVIAEAMLGRVPAEGRGRADG